MESWIVEAIKWITVAVCVAVVVRVMARQISNDIIKHIFNKKDK